MKTFKDCVPCFFKQAENAAIISGANESDRKRIADELSQLIDKTSKEECPPYMGRKLYQLVTDITGKKDPFKKIKQVSNELALKLYPELKRMVRESESRLMTATLLAIIGNIIDYGAKESFDIDREISQLLNPNHDIASAYKKAIFDFTQFKEALDKTDSVLYLADNSGEVVFDKVLIEELNKDVTYVVRDNPIINDALKEDAIFCGIDKVAHVITSGCDGPGVMLQYCTDEFLELFNSAKMIISKGQGNFEALNTEDNKPIFFLFRIKCDIVAKHIGFNIGDVILSNNHKG